MNAPPNRGPIACGEEQIGEGRDVLAEGLGEGQGNGGVDHVEAIGGGSSKAVTGKKKPVSVGRERQSRSCTYVAGCHAPPG